MNKEYNHLLVVHKDSFFYKITTFFRSRFFKSSQKEVLSEDKSIPKLMSITGSSTKSSFLEEIKIADNQEYQSLLDLQRCFEFGKIQEKNLSVKEKIALEKLYTQQIYDLKQSISNYKAKILSIKTRLAHH